jgi:hypothetical protein
VTSQRTAELPRVDPPDGPAEGARPRTRDYLWGLVVVLVGVVLVTAVVVWLLVGSSSCGTRPAPGYEDAGGSGCRSLAGPGQVAGPMPEGIDIAYWTVAAPAPPYRRST